MTGPTHASGREKCGLLLQCCKTKYLEKQAKQIMTRSATFAEVLVALESHPTTPCCLTRPDTHNIIAYADASGATGLTPTTAGAALKLRAEARVRQEQHQLTGITVFGASSHGELKTLAIIVDAINNPGGQACDRRLHVWVVDAAALDFQIIRRLT